MSLPKQSPESKAITSALVEDGKVYFSYAQIQSSISGIGMSINLFIN